MTIGPTLQTKAPFVPRKPWRGWSRCQPIVIKTDDGVVRDVAEVWTNLRFKVLSSVHLAEYKGRLRWQYQVSISVLPRASTQAVRHLAMIAALVGGAADVRRAIQPRSEDGERRAAVDEIAQVLKDFDMVGAEEDNHEPGRARHFWRLCAPEPGEVIGECECKTTEEIVVEPDGHTWSKERSE